jgi:hypothetical protein
MDIRNLLKSSRQKIARADQHVKELKSKTDPLDRHLYEITNQREIETVLHTIPTVYRLTYRPKEKISDACAAIIGDAFNNIREAFDYAASAIVNAYGERPRSKLYFPITSRKDLDSHAGLAALEKAVPGFKSAFLTEVRPADGPNEHLWNFYALHNDGKHNDFIPVATLSNVRPVNARSGGLVISNADVGDDADLPYVLIQAGQPIILDHELNAYVTLTFAAGTVFQGKLVIETLAQISRLSAETMDWIERFVFQAKG